MLDRDGVVLWCNRPWRLGDIGKIVGRPIWSWCATKVLEREVRAAVRTCLASGSATIDTTTDILGDSVHFRGRLDRMDGSGNVGVASIYVEAHPVPALLLSLTARELEVMHLSYMKSADIAADLGVTLSTVQKHRSRVAKKSGLAFVDAVKLAHDAGML